MLLDTHCHLKLIQERGEDLTALLEKLGQEKYSFILDIGTLSDDLRSRKEVIKNAIEKISDDEIKKQVQKIIHYSAGIWPDPDSIKNRETEVEKLRKSVDSNPDIIGIGECGLDHHWNVSNGVASGADYRDETLFTEDLIQAEKELFKMQIKLAEEKNLPLIIHSRDAFQDTLQCIKECGYHNGIIHCYSYGIDEAKAFLDLGWYIALGGAITYTKKSKMEDMIKLINFIPKDRLLVETDAPYLAPVPERGKTNTPYLIRHTYNFIASARNMPLEELEDIVNRNTESLFF